MFTLLLGLTFILPIFSNSAKAQDMAMYPRMDTNYFPLELEGEAEPDIDDYYTFMAGNEITSADGSGSNLQAMYLKVDPNPLTKPPCLLTDEPLLLGEMKQRHTRMSGRRSLKWVDLVSEKIQTAGYLAAEYYMAKNESILEIKRIFGGCTMRLAGELLFLMFDAREIIPCIDGVATSRGQRFNCTERNQVESVVLDRECRARVLLPDRGQPYPFYINCKSTEYFLLPWKRLKETQELYGNRTSTTYSQHQLQRKK